METKLTNEEIEAKRYQFNFDELLKPYKEGGTESHPVERTMGTIIDYLLNKKKYPMEIIGAAILIVFMKMRSGLRFKGDGTYGSAGSEMVTSIRIMCDKLLRQKLKGDLYAQIAQGRMDEMKLFIENQMLVTINPLVTTPWYRRLPLSKYRKWRKAVKRHINSLTQPEEESNVAA